jgi:competence protein ComEC
MKISKYPIISITVFFSTGIAAGHYLHPVPWAVYTAFLIAAIALILSFFKSGKNLIQKPHFAGCTWLLSLAAGLCSYTIHYAPNQSSHYSHFVKQNKIPTIKGVVSERLKPNQFAEKYYFNVTAVDNYPASGKLLITVPHDSVRTNLHAGDQLVIVDDLKPISKSLNPYQFDYSKYMEGQNVFHQVKMKDNYIVPGQQHNLDYYLENLRNLLMNSFDVHQYDKATINIINALLLGQRQDMDAETATNYTDAGVVHILAISGLHIAILFYILNIILKPLNRFNKKGRLLQLLLVLSFLWFFAFISGLSASVVRSVVMFSFVSIGLFFNRSANIYNSIAVSMLFLLLVKPMFLFDVGFQLSYAAVFAIVWLQPLYKRIKISRYKLINYIADTALISLVAQIAVLPLSLYYFNQFPLLFLLANIVVVPLSTLILIVGIIVLMLNFIWADAAVLISKLLGLLIEGMNIFIAWIASFDKLVLKDIPFTMTLNILLYTLIILFVLWMYNKSFYRSAALLSAVIVFQATYIATSVKAEKTEELVIFNNWGNSLITIKESNRITAYTDDSLYSPDKNLLTYNKGNFNQKINIKPLNNLLWFKKNKIMILDSLGVYDSLVKPDVLVITQSPKVNMDRVLSELQPKQVIADATNYKTYIARWATTCKKQKIPFHATAEKGFYKIE